MTTSIKVPSLLTPPNPSGDNNSGKLSATILSVYDIPPTKDGNGSSPVPSYVSMSVLGKEVMTGKPSSKHKTMNNFKFVTPSNDKTNGPATNTLSLSAPLSILYPTTVTFRVVFNSNENLVAKCKLSSILQINQQKWLILNLYPASAYEKYEKNGTSSPMDEAASEATSAPASPTPSPSSDHQPTLRIRLCLSGPYRTEIGAVLSLAQSWFHIMDTISLSTNKTVSSFTKALPLKLPSAKILLVPTVPLAAASVALLPLVLGVLTVGLPFFLPFLVVLLAVGVGTFLIGSGVYFSTIEGRESASTILGPIYSTFISTAAGQRLLYQTGPRPSPSALARTVTPTDMVGKLIVSLVIDFIGSSSYLLPFVGEAFDLAWAPIQTIFIMALYDESMPSLKYISFMEEILPFTDVLPSGMLGWVREFSPLLMTEGLKRVDDLKVVMRGEKESLRQGLRT